MRTDYEEAVFDWTHFFIARHRHEVPGLPGRRKYRRQQNDVMVSRLLPLELDHRVCGRIEPQPGRHGPTERTIQSYEPQDGKLMARCWCQAHDVDVPVELIRAGQTISCGSEECHGLDSAAVRQERIQRAGRLLAPARKPAVSTCKGCGTVIEQASGAGRTRLYCNRRCAEKARRARCR